MLLIQYRHDNNTHNIYEQIEAIAHKLHDTSKQDIIVIPDTISISEMDISQLRTLRDFINNYIDMYDRDNK